MTSISGPAQSAAISQLLTNAPVRPVRRIPSDDERVATPQADRYVASGSFSPAPRLTYGRDGQGGGSWGGGRAPAPQVAAGRDVDHDGDNA